MNTTAVVILNYNGSKFLQQFLPTLIKYSGKAQIVVADNNSSDDSLEILKQFPKVTALALTENYGYAGGYNEALKQISANYYALVNSDIEVTKGWLEPLITFLENNSEYAAVQPKILDFKNRHHFEYAGASGGFMDSLGYAYCRGRIFDTLEEDTGQYDTNTDVFWTTGACFMIRSSVFHKIGGFPADFFAHMEEVDLCWRLLSNDFKLAAIPESTVFHVGGGTLNKTSSRKTYLNFRNNIRLLVRNLPKGQLLLTLPIRIVLDWAAALLFWKQQSFEHFTAVFKAHKDALSSLRLDLSQKDRSKPRIMTSSWIVLKYYFSGKKSFKELNNTK